MAGAVIISDGQNNNGINPKSLIKNIKVPVYTLGIGETKPLIDLSIESVDAPTVAVKGENVNIKATINSIEKGHINKINSEEISNSLNSWKVLVDLSGILGLKKEEEMSKTVPKGEEKIEVDEINILINKREEAKSLKLL